MKPKHILALGLLALGLGSCGEGFFEQYPSNNITEGNFYKTDDDFNQGVVACYAKLKTQMSFHLTEIGYRSDENVLESMAVSTQDRYDIDHFAETASNGILNDIWDAWYNGIYRCNDVLDHMAGAKIANYDKYRGECLFMRSWWYFNLYRVFGVVPITRTVVAPAAAKLIPPLYGGGDVHPADRRPRGSRPTAAVDARRREGPRGEHRGLHAAGEGLPHVRKARRSQNGSGRGDEKHGLRAGIHDEKAFDVGNKMNKEIIFALYYNKTNDNGHGYWYSANTEVLADIRNPTPEFKAIYDGGKDNRLPLIGTYTKISSNLFAMTKWYDTYDATYTTQVGNDFPHLRYADVVLMYAEALAESGGSLGDALVWLNKTRTRAGLDELTTDEVKSLAEFRRELAAERGPRIRPRRPPLVRPRAAGAGRRLFPRTGLYARLAQPDLPDPAEPDRNREQPVDSVAESRFQLTNIISQNKHEKDNQPFADIVHRRGPHRMLE